MALVAAMGVIVNRSMVGMRLVAMSMGALAVDMRALWRACVAVVIDVHVQATQLRGYQAHAGEDHDGWAHATHLKIISPRLASSPALAYVYECDKVLRKSPPAL